MNEISQLIDTSAKPDPTWQLAQSIVEQRIDAPSPVLQFVRGGWNERLASLEFVRLVGGSRMNVNCLLQAAEFYGDGRRPDATYIIKSVEKLGVRFSAVVLTINLLVRLLLKSKPPPLWRGLCREAMSSVEVGYRLGDKVPAIGSAAGALMGFARYAGLATLLIDNPVAFKEWRRREKLSGKVGRKVEVELFGCEGYQVSAFVLQRLGFGVSVAAGAALGVGDLNPSHLSLQKELLQWKAVIQWIDALRLGRDMPRDPEVRAVFPEIAPPKTGLARNPLLGVLYTEIAPIKGSGSTWTWHLPIPDYDQTAAEWKLE